MRKTKKEGQTLLDAACAAGRCDKTGKSLVSTRFAGNNNTKGSATPGSSKKRKGAAAANGDGDGDGEAEADVETPSRFSYPVHFEKGSLVVASAGLITDAVSHQRRSSVSIRKRSRSKTMWMALMLSSPRVQCRHWVHRDLRDER